MSKSKKIIKQEPRKIIAFWRPDDQYSYFGQWYESNFILTQDLCDNFPEEIKNIGLYKDRYDVLTMLMNIRFTTAEKFMMMGKSALFRDDNTFRLMRNTNSPKEHKRLGRLVRNFDNDTWETYCRDIVIIGNYLKFSQNNELKNYIVNTGNAILVEGSPLDKIWGVGLKFDHPDIQHVDRWKGTNYLGECLMFVRQLF
jgi:ribA/ribD-fused uncharacterized protein